MIWYLADEVEIWDLDAQHAFILLSEREAVLDQDAILRRAEQRHHHHLHLQTHDTNSITFFKMILHHLQHQLGHIMADSSPN